MSVSICVHMDVFVSADVDMSLLSYNNQISPTKAVLSLRWDMLVPRNVSDSCNIRCSSKGSQRNHGKKPARSMERRSIHDP